MRKNGFTLIELLAVIVILAIIALIATPIILGIINDAREESNERSVELYASAVRNGIAAYQLREGKEVTPNTYTKETLPFEVEYDGKVDCTSIIISEEGKVSLDGCTVNGGDKVYSYGTKQSDESDEVETPDNGETPEKFGKSCTIKMQDKTKYSIGDEVTCTGKENWLEKFYIIEDASLDTDTIQMLTEKNLGSGYLQSDNGDTISFSNNTYWLDDYYKVLPQYENGFVYDSNSKLYKYLLEYELIVEADYNLNIVRTTLISKEQLNAIRENGNPSWVYSTSYWTGSFEEDEELMIFAIEDDGEIKSTLYRDEYGIRPVVTLSKSDLIH